MSEKHVFNFKNGWTTYLSFTEQEDRILCNTGGLIQPDNASLIAFGKWFRSVMAVYKGDKRPMLMVWDDGKKVWFSPDMVKPRKAR